ncbi:MAG: DUF5106 domain-containing protein [Tannerella sp.]|jgi:hypothetical protein|nr:DUF5106 domain-containing protein [Tannerella sp.]
MYCSRLYVVLAVLPCLWLSGCKDKPREIAVKPRDFPMVTIPAVYTDPQMRAEYLAMHYWDRFDFRDTTGVGSAAKVSEQALVNYIEILSYASYDAASQGLTHLMDLAENDPDVHAFFAFNLERYLYEADSPMHNDELYMPVLAHLLASKKVDDTRKIRLKMLWGYLQKNRPGTPAAEIHYRTASGRQQSLSELRSEYVLLVFHNLGCNACITLIDRITHSAVIHEMQNRQRLRILAIYPDKQLEEWKSHLHEIPPSWLSGYDYNAEIEDNETYILRAIPSVYLLDRNKHVVLRDVSIAAVEGYLGTVE